MVGYGFGLSGLGAVGVCGGPEHPGSGFDVMQFSNEAVAAADLPDGKMFPANGSTPIGGI